jgi:hypothetical protein
MKCDKGNKHLMETPTKSLKGEPTGRNKYKNYTRSTPINNKAHLKKR